MSWRFVVLAEIQNFSALRRHVGKSRADRLIADVAARAESAVGAGAVVPVGRTILEIDLLGDRFEDVESPLDRLAEAFAEPLDIDGECYVIDLLLAAAAAPIGGIEDIRLAEAAEGALAQANADGRRVVHDASRSTPSIDKASLRHELERAIARDEVFLQYQPKVHVRRRVVTSAEALVRWEHPTRGLILPNDFIPLAEETQLIGPLTLWTIRRVIADQRTLRAEGHDLTIFVNISGQLLGDARFIATACAMIADSGAKIGFEITETSMIRDPDLAIGHLKLIAGKGVPISIDDYGAGLSSLAYLKQLPATELKIDKMFVLELTSSNRDPLIVRSTIDLAHAMEMEVVAEGVETPAALALLTVMGCDLVQGFLLSRPVSLPAFRQFLTHEAPQLLGDNGGAFQRPPAFWRVA